MEAEYLYRLADLADPEQLWKLSSFEQLDLPKAKRERLDMGIALRRYASHIEQLDMAIQLNQSCLITPIKHHGHTAQAFVPIPDKHKDLFK